VYPPTPDVRCEASRIENEIVVDATYNGLITKDQMFALLLKNGLWTLQEEQQYTSLPTVVETLKLQMWQFHSKFAGKRVEQTRKSLRKQEQIYRELSAKRLQYDIHTAEGHALFSRFDYIVANSTYDAAGNVPDDIDDGRLIRILVNLYMSNMLNDTQTREVAKSPLWKMIWYASKSESMFGCPSANLTDEQISVLNWSRMYDSVYESMECPNDTVINDDDLLDGWLITQSRTRESERAQHLGDKHGGKKGSHEMFIPAETPEDAARIDAMNDPNARAIKRQRLQLAGKHGVVKEQNMPDSQLTMRQQALLETKQKMKGK